MRAGRMCKGRPSPEERSLYSGMEWEPVFQLRIFFIWDKFLITLESDGFHFYSTMR